MNKHQQNHLANSLSPYLLQHADNPVNWYPWGEEAFELARQGDKPIFLSIGYAACHWCHVMAHESFEDEQTAADLNEHYICIKVDREEHPDVDEIYMTAVQMMTGSGGWPLSVFLTPELKPFYGGTYFPPQNSYGRPGFRQVLEQVLNAYQNNRGQIEHGLKQIMAGLDRLSGSGSQAEDYDAQVVQKAIQAVKANFDPDLGGFGSAPKFPPTGQIEILLRDYFRTGADESLNMVRLTLDRMGKGGIFDQLGGGFHRYSTDAEWLVPHFEKMLYDNALLTQSCLNAYLVTKDESFRELAQLTLDWVLREMTDQNGGFYSSLDADSEGEEGKYYVWSKGEITSILGEVESELFCAAYDISPEGNFESHQNIPHLSHKLAAVSQQFEIADESAFRERLRQSREKLLAVRSHRVRPGTDDKVLTDWNGLMVAALARASRVLGDQSYLAAANRSAEFLWTRMWVKQRLLHSYRAGVAGIDGLLEDYAYLIQGLVELYQASFEPKHLVRAQLLADQMIELFLDQSRGGFYQVPEGRADLIQRPKQGHDGALPAGNAIAAESLYHLYLLTDRDFYRELAEQTVRAFVPDLNQNPAYYLRLISVIDELTSAPAQLVILTPQPAARDNEMVRSVNNLYLPGLVLAQNNLGGVADLALFRNREVIENHVTAYYCHDFICEAPVTDVLALNQLLGARPPEE